MDSKFYVRVRAYEKRNGGNQPLDLKLQARKGQWERSPS
jgi:hypothetical protein